MSNLDDFLISLLSAPGLSAFEGPVSKIIEEKWAHLTDEISHSQLGSLHAIRRASKPGPNSSLMIAAHMDAIGLLVNRIEDGFLYVSAIGGIDPRILPGQCVLVHGTEDIPGVIQMIPDRLTKSGSPGESPIFARLFVDTGLDDRRLQKMVRVGTEISFAQSPIQFSSAYVAGHSLDNRASVAALTVCLEEIRNFQLQWDVWAVATVQEELHVIGAATSAYQIKPDLAIAVDVTFAKGPGSNDYQTFPLGKGITIGVGGNIHPGLNKWFKEMAEEIDLPFSIETMPRSSGTDSMAMQITAKGIPTMVLGIPIRYMHTPVEMAAMKDIKRAGRLLAKFITTLADEPVEKFLGEKSA